MDKLRRAWNAFRAMPAIVKACVLVILLSLGMMVDAHADLVLRNDGNGAELRLLPSACSHAGTLALIREDRRAEFKDMRYLENGRIEHYGCWVDLGNGTALVLFEDGSMGQMKLAGFKETGV
jgi:hypothetical protein